MIEYVDGRYFVAQWFLPGPGRDFLGALYRDEKTGKFVFRYRFRYYAAGPGNPHDGRDEKSWYTATYAGESEDEAERKCDILVAELRNMGWTREQPDKLVLKSASAEENVKKLLERPYNHVTPTGRGGVA